MMQQKQLQSLTLCELNTRAANNAAETVSASMDEAIAALTAFDAERLEAVEARIRAVTAEYLAREIAEDREALPEMLRKHTLLGEMLKATAANLKVVVAVLNAKRMRLNETLDFEPNDRSNLVSWPR